MVDLRAYPNRRNLLEVLAMHSPSLCFLDMGSARDNALSVLSEISASKTPVPVVSIHSGNDPDLILRCLRQGAREFLHQPFTGEQLVATFDRLSRYVTNAKERSGSARVYCVMPGKGASGATTLACNLAFSLHARKTGKVLLADLDPSTGTLSFLLKLRSQFSFVDALTNATNMDEDIWKALVTPYQGLDVVLSPESPVDRPTEPHETAAMVEFARGLYNSVVIDAPSPYGDWGLSLARLSDELLLVTTNELPTLHATQKALAHMERNGIERSKVRLIVNRYNPDAGLGRDAIEKALYMDVFEVLPSDYEAVQKALLDGKPVPPGSNLGKSISSIAGRLSGQEVKAKNKSLIRGLVSLFETTFDR